jgi:PTH1 family peptidyl-tRNA hydrolase
MLVGLGNPGPKYERNRHNIGFRVVDELARRHHLGAFQSKLGGELVTGLLQTPTGPEKAALFKPMQFMNLSGQPVQRVAQYFQAEADRMIVIHDEIDLDFGRLRLKQGGGHGGHNGLRSIVAQLGTSDFYRVRVGVGKPPRAEDTGSEEQKRKVSSHVLSDFPASMASEVAALVTRAADAVEAIIGRGLNAAMNEFN